MKHKFNRNKKNGGNDYDTYNGKIDSCNHGTDTYAIIGICCRSYGWDRIIRNWRNLRRIFAVHSNRGSDWMDVEKKALSLRRSTSGALAFL